MDTSELDAINEFIDSVDIDDIEISNLDEDGDMVTPDSFDGTVHPLEDGVQVRRDQLDDNQPNQGEQADEARARAREYERRYRRKKKVPECVSRRKRAFYIEEIKRKRQQAIVELEEEYAAVWSHVEAHNAQWRYITNGPTRSMRALQLQELCSVVIESCESTRETAKREKWPAPLINQICEIIRALRSRYGDIESRSPYSSVD
ncbi:hypothetical protein FI667_g12999, partial [Globisporangium splendens]